MRKKELLLGILQMFVTLVKARGERVLPVPAAIDDQADAVAVQQVDIVRGLNGAQVQGAPARAARQAGVLA